MPDLPTLSVVVVTAHTFANIRRTVAHLRRQTVAAEMEVLMVAATPDHLADAETGELEGFGGVQRICPGQTIENVDTAAALAVPHVRADLVALIEDHAYPEPTWAERLIAAHRSGRWAAVGPTMVNANPRSLLSWTNLLIAYGPWSEPAHAGERDTLPGHNLCYRRDVLAAYGERLVSRLSRTGGLLDELVEQGHHLYLSDARLAHANPSRVLPTVQLRFNAGRLYGWMRAHQHEWTPLHRVLYVGGGPLIPLLRFRRLREELFGGGRRMHLVPRIWPALLFGLVLDGLGQMAGYAFGPGRAPDVLAVFEMDRMQHLTRHDRRLLHEAPPASQRIG